MKCINKKVKLQTGCPDIRGGMKGKQAHLQRWQCGDGSCLPPSHHFPSSGDSEWITIILKVTPSITYGNSFAQFLFGTQEYKISRLLVFSTPITFGSQFYNLYTTAFHTDQSRQAALIGFWDQIRQALHSLSYMWLKLSILYNCGLHISCCTVKGAHVVWNVSTVCISPHTNQQGHLMHCQAPNKSWLWYPDSDLMWADTNSFISVGSAGAKIVVEPFMWGFKHT